VGKENGEAVSPPQLTRKYERALYSPGGIWGEDLAENQNDFGAHTKTAFVE